MSLHSSVNDNRLIIAFESRVDTNVCRSIEPELTARLENWQGPIVFDLDGVEYVSSAFLRLVLQAIRHAGAENFSFTRVEPTIKLVLKTAGLDEHIAEDHTGP